ncbi:MAG: CAP domain-containing protein [Desulfomonilaceae bacterium]
MCFIGLCLTALPDVSFSKDFTPENRPKHPQAQPQEKLDRPEQILAERLLRETNKARSKEGLGPLTASHGLDVIARTHSRNMCAAGELKHESDKYPAGWRTFAERMKRMGYSSGAENLAYRTYSGRPEDWARSVVTGWLNSPPHRKNLLDPTFRYVGIGVFVCRNGVAFATQVFSPARVSAK